MIAEPLLAGATHCTVADPFPGDADVIVGALGTVAGTTAADGADAGLVPIALVAVTVHL